MPSAGAILDMGHKAPNAAMPGLSSVICDYHIIVLLFGNQNQARFLRDLQEHQGARERPQATEQGTSRISTNTAVVT